jgi:hypothetical protein
MVGTQVHVKNSMQRIKPYISDLKPSTPQHEYFMKQVQGHLPKNQTLAFCTKNNVFAGLGYYKNSDQMNNTLENLLEIKIGCWYQYPTGWTWGSSVFPLNPLKEIPDIKALNINEEYNIVIILGNDEEMDLESFEQKFEKKESENKSFCEIV